MSSRARVRRGTGEASPPSLTDLSQPSLDERMIWVKAALIIYILYICNIYMLYYYTALCDHDVDSALILKE